jgi:hypothetical protein
VLRGKRLQPENGEALIFESIVSQGLLVWRD